jgi:hypothetical protein
VISSVPSSVSFGSTFGVGTPDANVTKAVLVAPGNVTHANDMNQRVVEVGLNRRSDGTGVDLTAPANANIAPPGYYMLFLLNDQGVPSVARFVRLGGTAPPAADTQAPTAPTALDATAGSSSQVDLRWSGASDDVGVTGYDVHRDGSRIATTGEVTSYSGPTAAPSTAYSYTVRARDGAGNVSSESSAASVTTPAAGGDPPPPSGSDVALSRTATSSSQESSTYSAPKGNDGSGTTRWSSGKSLAIGQWWRVDLASAQTVGRVTIDWEVAYAPAYDVQSPRTALPGARRRRSPSPPRA